MAVTSKEAIANLALTKLGANRILTFADSNKEGRAVNAVYDILKDGLLRKYNWKFAITRKKLGKLSSAPVDSSFDYEYQIPNDVLRLITVKDSWEALSLVNYRNESDPEYAVESGKILIDMDSPIYIRYVKKIDDAGKFDALFVEALACKLAYEMCEDLTQSNTKKEKAEKAYDKSLSDAAMADAIERPPEPLPDDSWVLARA